MTIIIREGSGAFCHRFVNSSPREGKNAGAIEGTRTPTPLRVHGPEPCASANSATMAKSDSVTGTLASHLQERTTDSILQARRWLSNLAARLENYPSSLAVIVIFALSTFDTGHPLLAFSAAF